MSKIVYLNSHLEKFREKSDIKFNIDEIEGLANYNYLFKEDKKTTKIFTKCFIINLFNRQYCFGR